MMKLYAFDDQKDEEKKDSGRHHAMDLYRIVAMMTEQQYEGCLALGKVHREAPCLLRASQIVSSYFTRPTDLGLLRFQEHPLFRADLDTDSFSSVLREILMQQPPSESPSPLGS